MVSPRIRNHGKQVTNRLAHVIEAVVSILRHDGLVLVGHGAS